MTPKILFLLLRFSRECRRFHLSEFCFPRTRENSPHAHRRPYFQCSRQETDLNMIFMFTGRDWRDLKLWEPSITKYWMNYLGKFPARLAWTSSEMSEFRDSAMYFRKKWELILFFKLAFWYTRDKNAVQQDDENIWRNKYAGVTIQIRDTWERQDC